MESMPHLHGMLFLLNLSGITLKTSDCYFNSSMLIRLSNTIESQNLKWRIGIIYPGALKKIFIDSSMEYGHKNLKESAECAHPIKGSLRCSWRI